jgi:hypothetical protein
MRSPIQNFMSAEALRLTGNEHRALIEVLGMLERGDVKHYQGEVDWEPMERYDPSTINFNMANWASTSDCGTVHCIGGFAQAICQVNYGDVCSPSMSRRYVSEGLEDLFYPDGEDDFPVLLDAITVDQAAAALRNYLTTGAPDWLDVLGL